jgi:hypothetical protein
MAYKVNRWDNWSEFEGQRGLEGLSAMLTAEEAGGMQLSQIIVHSEDIYLVVLHGEPG